MEQEEQIEKWKRQTIPTASCGVALVPARGDAAQADARFASWPWRSEVPRIQLYRRTRDQASNCAKILGSFQAASPRDYTVPILEPITSTFLFARYSSM